MIRFKFANFDSYFFGIQSHCQFSTLPIVQFSQVVDKIFPSTDSTLCSYSMPVPSCPTILKTKLKLNPKFEIKEQQVTK